MLFMLGGHFYFSQPLCIQSPTLQAYIRVLDMNEHRPVFLKPLYEVRLVQRAGTFTFRCRVQSLGASCCFRKKQLSSGERRVLLKVN